MHQWHFTNSDVHSQHTGTQATLLKWFYKPNSFIKICFINVCIIFGYSQERAYFWGLALSCCHVQNQFNQQQWSAKDHGLLKQSSLWKEEFIIKIDHNDHSKKSGLS